MMSNRSILSVLAIATALAAGPALAQQAPAAPAEPAAPTGPASGPNSLAVSHTISNLTNKPVQVVIRTDGGELFSGRLEARPPTAKEDDPSPEIKPVVTFDVPEEKTLFWEVIYTAIPEETRRSQQEQPKKDEPKFCRQAWTAVVAPGSAEPQMVVPVQLVNSFGNCNFAIETTDEQVFDIALAMDIPPQ